MDSKYKNAIVMFQNDWNVNFTENIGFRQRSHFKKTDTVNEFQKREIFHNLSEFVFLPFSTLLERVLIASYFAL